MLQYPQGVEHGYDRERRLPGCEVHMHAIPEVAACKHGQRQKIEVTPRIALEAAEAEFLPQSAAQDSPHEQRRKRRAHGRRDELFNAKLL